MRWNTSLDQGGTGPEQGWPEKTNRKVIALVVAAMLVGTPIASMLMFSKHIDEETIEIEPYSYHAVYFGFFGIGRFSYSCSGVGWYDHVYLLEMDRVNFERLKAVSDYDYSSYTSIGSGGSGHTSSAGTLWEVFLVFVNDGPLTAKVWFEADSTAYFSLPAAMLCLGAVAVIGYAVMGRSRSRRPTAAAVLPTRGSSRERRKAIVAIAVAIASAAAVTVILGYVIPEDSPFGFGSLFWRSYFGILAGTAIVFTLKTRLHIVDGSPERVLAELTRRLRVSGYLVTEKRWHILVQISSTSAIRIYARPNPAGTLVLYRMEAASSGWVIVFILLLMRVTAPVAMAIALFMHYRTAVFASERVLPRLTAMPRLDGPPPKEAARTMLIDCLSEGRRLAKEAYDAARSNYEDSVLLLVLAALSGSAFLALYCNVFLLEDLEARTRLTATLLIGVVLGTVMSVGLWRVLARRSLPRMQELEAWSWRLNGALAREVAAGPPEDDEPSSFELIAESYEEMPKWLRARRKGGMSREPFQWLLIVFFLMYGVSLGFSGIMELLRADYQAATPILGIAAAFGGAAIAIYWHWKRTREEEDEKTKTSMANRLETLKTEMEAYLRSV